MTVVKWTASLCQVFAGDMLIVVAKHYSCVQVTVSTGQQLHSKQTLHQQQSEMLNLPCRNFSTFLLLTHRV